MSAPCFGWAIERGRALKLSASERWVLAVLANRANGARVCWPSLETIAADTGLSARTVFSAVHSLATKGLIEIRKFGRSLQYLIRRPADPPKPPDEPPQPLQGSGELSTGSPQPSQSSQPLQALRRNEVADTCKIDIATLANGDSCKSRRTRRNLPKIEPSPPPQSTKKENLERKSAIAHDLEGKEGKAPDPAPQREPAPEREQAAREREPTVHEIMAKRAEYAASIAALAKTAPHVAGALASLGSRLGQKAYAIGQRPIRDIAEQIAACTPVRSKARHLEGEQLAAFRAQARVPVIARAVA